MFKEASDLKIKLNEALQNDTLVLVSENGFKFSITRDGDDAITKSERSGEIIMANLYK